MVCLWRGLLPAASFLISAPTCSALLPSNPGIRHSAFRSVNPRNSAKCSQIAAWRGGAAIEGDTASPTMNLQLGLVRVAGYGIIAGSLGLKTPQISRVWQAQSLVGLAPASIYADVFLFATSVIYHVLKRNPIRAYGESVVVLVQTMVMVGLLWKFGGDDSEVDWAEGEAAPNKTSPGGGPIGRTAIIVGSVAACAACFRYLPEHLWGLLVIVSTPAIMAVQLPQITKNFKQRHTGEQAFLTVLLSFLGSSVRIATTVADLGADPWLLLNYVLGSVTNFLMLMQMYFFRVKTAAVRKRVTEARKLRVTPAA